MTPTPYFRGGARGSTDCSRLFSPVCRLKWPTIIIIRGTMNRRYWQKRIFFLGYFQCILSVVVCASADIGLKLQNQYLPPAAGYHYARPPNGNLQSSPQTVEYGAAVLCVRKQRHKVPFTFLARRQQQQMLTEKFTSPGAKRRQIECDKNKFPWIAGADGRAVRWRFSATAENYRCPE